MKRKKYVSDNPRLNAEWHPTKNGDLKPSVVTTLSHKKVWWLCEEGHDWLATVAGRSSGKGCPYCAGKKVWPGYNDLATLNPELADEWHPTKNGDLKPSMVTAFSHKKVWWLCEKGHDWQATIYNRSNGHGCPYCAGEKVWPGYNDLATVNPKLADEWHPTKNGDLKPSMIAPFSNKKVWWLCEEGHDWQATVYERSNGNGCPYCARKKAWPGYNDLATVNPKLASEWHPTKNGDLKPSMVTPFSHKKVWWLCEEGHDWQATVNDRGRGKGCQYCAGKKVWPGYNDLATVNPELADEWHPTKNGALKPNMITAFSHKKVWWLCKEGHDWMAIVNNRNKGHGCPYCAGKKAWPGYNDLATVNPELADEWHPTKNGALKPSMVTAFSNKKVWWICKNGDEWQANVNSRSNGNGCPKCNSQTNRYIGRYQYGT